MAFGIELGYQLDVAEAIAHSALKRRESRGAHQRLDGSTRATTPHFLKHSLAHYRPEGRRASITVRSPSPGHRPVDALRGGGRTHRAAGKEANHAA